MRIAVLLSALSGWLALSYEIVWYRLVSFASRGLSPAFGLLLAWYLFGLAGGALAARRAFQPGRTMWGPLSRYVLWANVLGFAVVPAASWMLTFENVGWASILPLVGVAAAGLGTVFPLLADAVVAADERAGAGISRLYVANIAGSVAGTLLTGFLLMDVASLRTTHLLLGLSGAALAGGVAWLGTRSLRSAAAPTAVAVAMLAGTPFLFDGVYERLQLKDSYRPGYRFAHVVETKSGVVTVDKEDVVYGGGIYDGIYNVNPAKAGNDILRAYAVAGLHPKPREVLQIGLATGSWAAVLAELPDLERLTVVEINPGYLELLPKYPAVAGLPTHPKVKLEVDDGRRWLVRNGGRRFDVIIGNVWNWRAGSTNLLSEEFLQLVRSRLKPGGIFYYNTTGSSRVVRTGVGQYPHALTVRNYLVLSDAPLVFDAPRARSFVEAARSAGVPLFDPSRSEDRKQVDEILKSMQAGMTGHAALLERTQRERVMTDDNMGTEWSADAP